MKDHDLYTQYCDNIKADIEAKSEERELMRDDQRFAAGDQWPDLIRKGREMSGRPIQTINRLPAFIDQIVGDARQNLAVGHRPIQIKKKERLLHALPRQQKIILGCSLAVRQIRRQ